MLISIAGSQGSGKSTVLKALQDKGYNIVVRKTARSILDEWNVSLDAVNQDLDLKMAFQMELVDRKFKDEIEFAYAEELYFTERTFADLFTYALISFGQYNQYDTWIDSYYKTCKDSCSNFSKVYYLQAKFSHNIENDGVRSVNEHYSRMIDVTMLDVTRAMVPAGNLIIINNPDIDERVEQVVNRIQHL